MTATRTGLLFISILGLAGIGWLAWSRWDAVAYLTDDYSAITGWAALRAAWPIFGFAGISTALVGLLLGGWAGEHARERDALAQVATAEARAAQAEEDAKHAQADAEAALAAQRQRAERAEQEARQREAAAEQARRDAAAQLPPAYQRITELTEDNALLKRRLAGALESLERRKRQVKELRQ